MAILHNQIRVRIGYNSEKSLNNPQFLNSLEVENKSATPYSSKRTREDPEKLKITFPIPSLLSPFS